MTEWVRDRDRIIPVILVLFLLQAFLSQRLGKWVHPIHYEASQSQQMDKRISSTLRAGALLTGCKVLIGHLFWIGVIQYYGDSDNAADRFSKLYDYCRLASDLNPQFISVYTYGGTALAFHLKRIDQASALFEKGIKANPDAPRLKLLQAAILYQHPDQMGLLIPILEEEASRPDAPQEMLNILANTYVKVGKNQEAIRVWKRILQGDFSREQKITAAQKLQELYKLLKNASDHAAR
jgi:tetratricopeptide (TPR) repeat protein